MIETTEIEATVKSIVAENTGKKPSSIKLESHLENDLGVDSIDTIDIIYEVEKRFKFIIPMTTEAVKRIKTVKDLVREVETTLNRS
jgi:acyl carrier protein